MTVVYQNLEGGTAGASLTTSDALGLGDTQWSAVNKGTNTTLAYSTAQAAHGTQSLLVATGTTSATAYAQMTVPSTTHLYGRFYIYLTGKPSGVNLSIARVVNSVSNNSIVTLRVTTGGFLQINMAAGSTVTSTTTFPLNTWTRIELEELPAATGGQCTVKCYTGDSLTPWDTIVATANDTELQAGHLRVGVPVAFTSAPAAYYDCIAVSDTTWVGRFIDPADMRSGSTSLTGTGTLAASGHKPAGNAYDLYGSGNITVVGGKNVSRQTPLALTGTGATTSVYGGRTNGPIPAANIVYGNWVDVGPTHAPYLRRVDVSTATQLFLALVNAIPGDAIFLADGTYKLDDVPSTTYNSYSIDYHRMGFTALNNGTAANPIIIRGSRNAILTVSGTGSYGLHVRGSYHRLEGFRVSVADKGIVMENSQFTVLDGVEVDNVQMEAVHFRSSSADCTIIRSKIHDTGLGSPQFGEGIYVGSAVSNWTSSFYSGGPVYGNGASGEDASNRVLIDTCFFYNIAAEGLDAKEGTVNGTIRNCRFYNAGYSGANSGDSWGAVKGNYWTIDSNTGAWALADAWQVNMELAPGYGHYNVFTSNSVDTIGTVPGYLVWFGPLNAQKDPGNNTVRSDNDASKTGLGMSNARLPADIGLHGSGALTATSGKSATTTVALTGTGAVAVTGFSSKTVVNPLLALTGSGAITVTGTRRSTGTTALTGTGTLTTSGRKTVTRTVALTSLGTTAATGRKTATSPTALTGTGTLTVPNGRKAAQRTTALTGTGTFTILNGNQGTGGSVTLTGTGTLTANGKQNPSGSVTLTGTGTLAPNGTRGRSGSVTLTGTGTLTANGKQNPSGSITLTANGTFTATGRKTAQRNTTLTGTGTLTVAHAGTAPQMWALDSTGTRKHVANMWVIAPDGSSRQPVAAVRQA